jgi:hypothetical protein
VVQAVHHGRSCQWGLHCIRSPYEASFPFTFPSEVNTYEYMSPVHLYICTCTPTYSHVHIYSHRFFLYPEQVDDLLQVLVEQNVWGSPNRTDSSGRTVVHPKLLLLGMLRILTRNWTVDDVSEQIGASRRTVRLYHCLHIHTHILIYTYVHTYR